MSLSSQKKKREGGEGREAMSSAFAVRRGGRGNEGCPLMPAGVHQKWFKGNENCSRQEEKEKRKIGDKKKELIIKKKKNSIRVRKTHLSPPTPKGRKDKEIWS